MEKGIVFGLFLGIFLIGMIGMVSAKNCTVKEDCYPVGVYPPTCGNVNSCLNGQCVVAAVDCVTPKNLSDYYNAINYSCQQDSDCVIKDRHKCCGVDYWCMNKNAFVYPDFVKAQCEIEEVASTCDVNIPQACVCENNKCVGKENDTSCNNLYWFDDTNKECSQKEFCGAYMYLGLQTFESKTQCEKALNDSGCPLVYVIAGDECVQDRVCPNVQLASFQNEEACLKALNKTCKEFDKCVYGSGCCEGFNCVESGDFGYGRCMKCDSVEMQGKGIVTKCYKTLSNGRKAEIKIMPETASATAIERLGELNFTIELKEVGKGDDVEPVYELTGKKEGKFLGIFKIMASERVQVDAETGEVKKVIKPWWSFLATKI